MKRSQKQPRRRRDREDRPLSPYAKKQKTPHRYEGDDGNDYTTTPEEGEIRRRPRATKRSAFRPFTRPGSS